MIQQYRAMRHIPVLLQKIIDGLNLRVSNEKVFFIDCNLGDGGHSEAVIKSLRGNVHLIGIDLDPDAISRANQNIQKCIEIESSKDATFKKPTLTFIQDNFRHLQKNIDDLVAKGQLEGFQKADAILFDLGISSYEIDESGRGFSFKKDEPLLMTFGQKEKYAFTAYDIINDWDEENIANIIYAYGEDRLSKRIAKRIVEKRQESPIKTTLQLAEIVKGAYPASLRYGKIHPATRTFQALRIAVNDELQSIKEALPQAVNLLKENGRICIISFHSLEDRIVKNFFKENSDSGQLEILTKKPIVPSDDEININPRSRSSKLRIAERTDKR